MGAIPDQLLVQGLSHNSSIVDIYHTGFDDIQLTHFRQMGPLVKAAIESAIANVSIIVLLNGCFDINPVLCPSTVVLSRAQLYGPEATPRINTAVRDSIRLYEDIIQD